MPGNRHKIGRHTGKINWIRYLHKRSRIHGLNLLIINNNNKNIYIFNLFFYYFSNCSKQKNETFLRYSQTNKQHPLRYCFLKNLFDRKFYSGVLPCFCSYAQILEKFYATNCIYYLILPSVKSKCCDTFCYKLHIRLSGFTNIFYFDLTEHFWLFIRWYMLFTRHWIFLCFNNYIFHVNWV